MISRIFPGLPTDIGSAITRFELACYDLAEAVTTEGTNVAAKTVADRRKQLVKAILAWHAPSVLPAGQTVMLDAPTHATPSVEEVLRAAAPREPLALFMPSDDTEGGAA